MGRPEERKGSNIYIQGARVPVYEEVIVHYDSSLWNGKSEELALLFVDSMMNWKQSLTSGLKMLSQNVQALIPEKEDILSELMDPVQLDGFSIQKPFVSLLKAQTANWSRKRRHPVGVNGSSSVGRILYPKTFRQPSQGSDSQLIPEKEDILLELMDPVQLDGFSIQKPFVDLLKAQTAHVFSSYHDHDAFILEYVNTNQQRRIQFRVASYLGAIASTIVLGKIRYSTNPG